MAETKKKSRKSGSEGFIRSIISHLDLYICPMLLGASLCYSIIYALYREMAVPCTAAFFALEYVLFSFFDRLKKRGGRGGAVYTLILFAAAAASMVLTEAGRYAARQWNAPSQWFYGADNFDHRQPLLLCALFIGGGYFLISILYYFTQVRYRTLGLMLCILFPFIIYAKRSNNMPDMMVTVIITMFLAVMIHNRRLDPADPQRERAYMKLDRSYIISAAIFISLTGAVAMTVKKPMFRSQLERNADYFDYMPTDVKVDDASFESISILSSARYGSRKLDGKELFRFRTNGERPVYYLRRQSYKNFTGDEWLMAQKPEEGYMYYSADYPEYSTDDVVADFIALASPDEPIPEGVIDVREGTVYGSGISPNYLPAPFGVITDSTPGAPKYKKLLTDYVMRRGSLDGAPLNDSFSFFDQTNELYAYARSLGLTGSDYIQLLASSSSMPAVQLFDDYNLALKNYTGMGEVSDSVIRLAFEVTEDCRSDMEKAEALEAYFENNGYVYDEDYYPNDTSIEYFLFEGKTGVCSSYATAMTLMARSVGMPARYVEGFAAFERGDNGEFIIRDKYSHAFVEVYIPGVGWLTFDPTVPSYMDEDTEESGGNSLSWLLDRFEIVIAVAVMIVLWLLRDRLYEVWFRLSQRFRSPKNAVLCLYANVVRLISFSTGEEHSAYTVNMLREYISQTRCAPPEEVFSLFEKTAFGGYEPTKDDYLRAYSDYKRCYKYLRKERGGGRAGGERRPSGRRVAAHSSRPGMRKT